MPYTETGKEKEKREAYYKANKERGIRAEKQKSYEMFGTTEQNIPAVDTMGNVTGMKKGGKVKKFGAGGEPSLEELYPEAKITRAGPQPPPKKEKWEIKEEERIRRSTPATTGTSVAQPKFTDAGDMQDLNKIRGGTGAMPKSNRDLLRNYKKGGTASSRADGCAIRGKTRA